MAATDAVTIKVNSQDNTSADFDALKAKLQALKDQRAEFTITGDDKEANAKLAGIDAKIAALSAKTAKPGITVAGAARAEADIAYVDLALTRLGDKTVKPKVDSSDVEHASTMTGLLVTGAAALGPAFAVAAVGAGIFGAAAIPALMNASKASSPLHSGLEELKTDYKNLSASVQPEVVTDFADAVTAAKNVLPEFTGVAQAGGKAVGDLITGFGQFAQSPGVKSFLSFVQAEAGPDIKAGEQALEGLAQGALGLVEALNPLGKLILPIVGDLGDFVADISKGAPLLVQFGVGATAIALGINKLAAGAKSIQESTVGAKLLTWASSLGSLATGLGEATIAEKAMFTATAALDAIDPVVWAVAAGAAVVGLGVLLVKTSGDTDDLVASMAKADHASGTNIAGYQKLSDQLKGTKGDQVAFQQSLADTTPFERAHDGITTISGDLDKVSAAQKAAADKADQLRASLQSQASQLGISVGAMSQVQLGIQTFGSATQTTTRQVQGLDQAWDILTGDLLGKQQALLTSQQNVAAFGDAVKNDGANSLVAKQAFLTAAEGIQSMADSLTKAHAPASEIYKDIESQISALKAAGPLTNQQKADLDALNSAAILVANSTKGMTAQQLNAAKTMEGQLIPQLKQLGVSSTTAKTDTDLLTNAVINTGAKSAATKGDRAQLIADLQKSGVNAKTATGLVDTYIGQIGKIPKNANTNVTVHGSGSGTISVSESLPGSKTAAVEKLIFGSTGLRLPGYGGGDVQPAMLEPGETVVSKEASRRPHMQAAFKAAGVPGYAAGGLVGAGNAATSAEPWAVGKENSWGSQVETLWAQALVAQAQRDAKAAAQQKAEAGSGGVAGNVASYAGDISKVLSMLGEPAGDLGAVEHRMQQESGGDPTIVNHSDSNAAKGTPSVGLMQVIGPTFQRWAGPYLHTGPFEFGTSINPMANIYAGLNYAKNEYRGRSLASVMLQPGGYAGGGATSAGWKLAGEHGRELVRLPGGASVIPNGQSEAMLSAAGAGPVVVHLDFGGGSGSSLVDAIVKELRKYIRTTGGGNVQLVLGGG